MKRFQTVFGASVLSLWACTGCTNAVDIGEELAKAFGKGGSGSTPEGRGGSASAAGGRQVRDGSGGNDGGRGPRASGGAGGGMIVLPGGASGFAGGGAFNAAGGAGGAGGSYAGGAGGPVEILEPVYAEGDCPLEGTFDRTPGRTYDIAYSQDGSLVATAAQTARPNLKIFRTSDNALVSQLPGHPQNTYGTAFSPNGELLASAGSIGDGVTADTTTVKIWRVSDGTLVHEVPANTGGYASSVQFSHDGKLLATSGGMYDIEIWRVSDWSRVLDIPTTDPQTTYTARFSPDDRYLVTSGTKNTAKVWRVADGSLVSTLVGHTYSVADAVFSPDGTEVATVGYDNTARIWNPMTGEQLQVLQQSDANRYLSRPLWVDANHLYTNDWNGGLRSWVRGADGKFTLECSIDLKGQSIGLAISPDHRELRASGIGARNQWGIGIEGVWVFRRTDAP